MAVERFYYSLGEVAILLGVGEPSVRKWVRRGKLRVRLRLLSGGMVRRIVDASDLLKFIDQWAPYEGQNPDSRAEKIMRRYKEMARHATESRLRRLAQEPKTEKDPSAKGLADEDRQAQWNRRGSKVQAESEGEDDRSLGGTGTMRKKGRIELTGLRDRDSQ
ncbi:MAG: helix-turn-helix domain-containing protein [Deltaproteobacteria bacterium]|nr:helix-turn-helix domain-containing protein [Deltaproteobacteria bacterium]